MPIPKLPNWHNDPAVEWPEQPAPSLPAEQPDTPAGSVSFERPEPVEVETGGVSGPGEAPYQPDVAHQPPVSTWVPAEPVERPADAGFLGDVDPGRPDAVTTEPPPAWERPADTGFLGDLERYRPDPEVPLADPTLPRAPDTPFEPMPQFQPPTGYDLGQIDRGPAFPEVNWTGRTKRADTFWYD